MARRGEAKKDRRNGESIPAAPGLLMIGAAARNAGKTEFACQVLKQLTRAGFGVAGAVPPGGGKTAESGVAAAKVTTVQEAGGLCPRGGQGCGVCASLETEWCISEETDPTGSKDTSRLLRAGATRVLWLRVLEESLAGGARELLSRNDSGRPWVCESNRLRTVVAPDLFLMVREAGSTALKPSAGSVAGLADAVVLSDGSSFQPGPEAVSLLDGAWTMKRDVTAIVLAGGRSRRMGTDKSLLELAGRPLIAHVVDQVLPQVGTVLVSAGGSERLAFLGLPLIRDRIAGAGPLVAIASALEDSASEWNLVVPCDMPKVPARLVTRMFRMREGVDAVVPVSGPHYEPLFALYRKSCLPAMWDAIGRGERKIIEVFRYLAIRTLPVPDGTMLANLNTPEEFRRYCKE